MMSTGLLIFYAICFIFGWLFFSLNKIMNPKKKDYSNSLVFLDAKINQTKEDFRVNQAILDSAYEMAAMYTSANLPPICLPFKIGVYHIHHEQSAKYLGVDTNKLILEKYHEIIKNLKR